TPQGIGRILCRSGTDIDGKLHVGVPVGVEVEVVVYRGGYIPQYITLNATTAVEWNITLEELITEVVIPPLADVTIVAKDRETGTPLPRTTLSGNGQYEGYSVSLGWGMTTNDYGVFTGQIPQGEYEFFYADHNIGHGRLDTVTIGPSNPEIVIMVDRFDIYGDMEEYHFTIRDSSGTPVPDVWVYIFPMVTYPGAAGKSLGSDASGEVRFLAYPGIPHMIEADERSPLEYRSMWGAMYTEITTPQEGGELDDLIVYSSRQLNVVHGFVRDSTDMGILTQAHLQTSSFGPGTDPMFNPYIADYWDDIIYLYTQRNGGSNENGYYRVRGRDTMFVLASADGYLPLLYRPEMVTRADLQHDILLDPIPEETFNISGTVIDQYGEPLDSGWLSVTDHDRGGASLKGWADMSDGNEFSFEVWNGNFTLCFENRTMRDQLTLEATGDQEGIVFMIIPEFVIDGTVTDREGTAVEGLNVSLILHDEVETEIAWALTDGEGYYAFEGLTMGDHTVRTGLTELYDPYETETIEASGWLDINVPIILENRSIADIFGRVLGEDGEYMGGIPGANVGLSQDGLHVVTTYADELGYFLFTNVSHGTNYSLKATPPAGLEPLVEIRSGYLENFTMNITVSGYEVELDLYLPYQVETPSDYLNITDVWPMPGAVDVPLDERIVITFSIGVLGSSINNLINITPPLENLMYSWTDEGMTLILECDDLLPNTTYEIVVPSTASSIDGYPLHPANVLTWNFTTGSTVATWKITGASVEFIGSVDLTVAVSGIEGISVYFVVDGVGSFLIPVELGAYRSVISISEFEWNTTYSYHFSSTDGGPDEAPAFSGTFTTPVNPAIPPGWDITEAVVTVDEDGDWTVEVTGEAGMDVFIVIDGWGSLKLEETEDGVYELTIAGDEFNWEETYSYHFSDSSGGDDLAPSESGTQTIPHKPARSDEDEDNLNQIAAVCCLSMVIVLLLFVLIFV
ncbi:MAG: Ig-like domain-containing protein, partial [Thermoplasmata archaeon]|nr:Ig-like domain-containing protein [Thermoplasmata archaeon]